MLGILNIEHAEHSSFSLHTWKRKCLHTFVSPDTIKL